MFESALEEMKKTGLPHWGPKSFQGYCMANSVKAPKTAEHISIDSQKGLAPGLRNAQCMVLRLGIPEGEKNTFFGLSKCVNGWGDYFLLDDVLFEGVAPEMFIPTVSFRHLFPFYLLPAFTETSLVNLALASGLMAHALGLDEQTLPLAAATGQSTHTFRFRPRIGMEEPWTHARGQVEIDSLFAARRGGKETVFIVESKAAGGLDSLAKHKLLYPLLAIRGKVPHYMPVVPIYLRVVPKEDGYHFYFAECELALPVDGDVPVLTDLHAVSQKHFVLRLFQGL
jgi:hypothetical protein